MIQWVTSLHFLAFWVAKIVQAVFAETGAGWPSRCIVHTDVSGARTHASLGFMPIVNIAIKASSIGNC